MPNLTAQQCTVKLPAVYKEKALQWVQNLPGAPKREGKQYPFRRQLDFWFASIAWAIHKGLDPVAEAKGEKIVMLGPNPNDIRSIESWMMDLLYILAANTFGQTPEGVAQATDPKKVVDLANRYAEAGAPSLIRCLTEQEDFEEPRLYRFLDFFQQEVSDSLSKLDRAYL